MSNRVSYFMDFNIGGFYYGKKHPMKPFRVEMTNNLVLSYSLHRKMDVYRPRLALPQELREFHSADYVDFLHRISPKNYSHLEKEMATFNVGAPGADCPVFDGLLEYCQRYTGASIEGAHLLMSGKADIAINWGGGLHHAKKSQASGFCYTNDIVLAILELLKFYPRVLYLDIDVHHGDGVEEAFYVTDRVLTISFHKYGDVFFPGTGSVFDNGAGLGKHFAINVPLRSGINDENYFRLFRTIMNRAMEKFKPSVIVLQCGADSLANDHLGCFNMTIKGHGRCVSFMKEFGIPMLVLGGGGYTMRNVARCWTYETSLLLDTMIDDVLPYNDYSAYYAPDHKLHISEMNNFKDQNDKIYVEKLKGKVMSLLGYLEGAPSVQMHEAVPLQELQLIETETEDNGDWTSKYEGRQADGEFYDDSKDHGMDARS